MRKDTVVRVNMRDSKVCKKCNSKDIVKADYRPGGRNEKYNIVVNMGLNSVDIDTYLCCNCGYVENWVPSEEVSFINTTLGEEQ